MIYYLFPYEKVKKDSRIAIYGYGKVGKCYVEQLIKNKYCEISFIVDKNRNLKISDFRTVIPDELATQNDFDYIVVATANMTFKKEIFHHILSQGIEEEKIITNITEIEIKDPLVNNSENNIKNKLFSAINKIDSGICRQKNISELITNYKSERKNKHNGSIKIGFIINDAYTFNKIETIYLMTKKSDSFTPYIICVPSNLSFSSDDNDVYKDFMNDSNALNAKNVDGTWLNIKSMNLEYVIYSKPYNNYLPPEYWSSNVFKFTKICYLQYGCPLPAYNFIDAGMNKEFLRYVYLYFAGNAEEKTINETRFKETHRRNIQKTVCLGWPYIETLENSKNEVSEAWAFSKNNTKVIWTPRWTLDESLGGTNFLRYKDDFLNLFEENIDIDFLIRPHPMMFENFLLSGQMSSDEIDLFYLKVNSSQNIRIDKSIRYESTLWESDFLISDYSSLTVQYFVTGKPMIYCVTENPELNYTNMFLSILDANYVAHNFDEVKKYFKQLSDGDDPKKKQRIRLRRSLFGDDLYDSSKKIVQYIKNDSNKNRKGHL